MKVLFLSASIGHGHDQVAKTLASKYKIQVPNSKYLILDIIKTISPFLSRVLMESYIGLLKHAPGVWGILHDQFAMPKKDSEPFELMNKVLANEVLSRIRHFNPDVIINTHAFASTITGTLKQQESISMPVNTVITDYNFHSFWTHKSIDNYFVATDLIKKIISELDISYEKIHVTGLPVRESFTSIKNSSISKVKGDLNIPDRKTLLFMGGGLGLGDILTIVKAVDNETSDTNLIIACGTNQELLNKVKSLKTNNNVYPLSFVENIQQYMYISDIIVTKPGGITITESLVLGKPLAFISPIPGQETHNQHYFLNQGVAISLPSNKYAGYILAKLLHNPGKRQIMSSLTHELINVNAAKDIIKTITDF